MKNIAIFFIAFMSMVTAWAACCIAQDVWRIVLAMRSYGFHFDF